MDPLPMAPSCALDDAGLRLQLERYRQAGAGARLIDSTPRSLVVDLDKQVETQLVEETIAIELSAPHSSHWIGSPSDGG